MRMRGPIVLGSPSGRLDDDDIAQLPRLRQEGLTSVLHYCDCLTDDARLTLSVLLDARGRGADILNRRAVTAIAPLANGYAIALDERGQKRSVEARFIVNAAGPWVARVDSLTEGAPPARPLRLVRGSHIVLPMPKPAQTDAYTLQDEEERVIFVIPWLEGRNPRPLWAAPCHFSCEPARPFWPRRRRATGVSTSCRRRPARLFPRR